MNSAKISIILKKTVVVEKLTKELIFLFSKELEKMEIGYGYDKHALCKMEDIMHAIDLLKTSPSREFSLQIIKLYA